jgi:hypothetical protein
MIAPSLYTYNNHKCNSKIKLRPGYTHTHTHTHTHTPIHVTFQKNWARWVLTLSAMWIWAVESAVCGFERFQPLKTQLCSARGSIIRGVAEVRDVDEVKGVACFFVTFFVLWWGERRCLFHTSLTHYTHTCLFLCFKHVEDSRHFNRDTQHISIEIHNTNLTSPQKIATP